MLSACGEDAKTEETVAATSSPADDASADVTAAAADAVAADDDAGDAQAVEDSNDCAEAEAESATFLQRFLAELLSNDYIGKPIT